MPPFPALTGGCGLRPPRVCGQLALYSVGRVQTSDTGHRACSYQAQTQACARLWRPDDDTFLQARGSSVVSVEFRQPHLAAQNSEAFLHDLRRHFSCPATMLWTWIWLLLLRSQRAHGAFTELSELHAEVEAGVQTSSLHGCHLEPTSCCQVHWKRLGGLVDDLPHGGNGSFPLWRRGVHGCRTLFAVLRQAASKLPLPPGSPAAAVAPCLQIFLVSLVPSSVRLLGAASSGRDCTRSGLHESGARA